MNISSTLGLSISLAKTATADMQIVQHAVPATRIVLSENFEPSNGAIRTPTIQANPVKAVPILQPFSLSKTDSKIVVEQKFIALRPDNWLNIAMRIPIYVAFLKRGSCSTYHELGFSSSIFSTITSYFYDCVITSFSFRCPSELDFSA